MTWGHPELLALVLLVPLVIAVAVLGWRARKRALDTLLPSELRAGLLGPGVVRARWLQTFLAGFVALALAVAAAGPRLGFDWQQQKVEGVAIVVVLDGSRSMDAADVSPSRIERARREIVDLVGLLRGDAVGLVVFAAGAYVRVPPTVDYGTLLWALDDTTTGTIRAQGTSLAGAIDAATQLLERADGSGKAILVVSDGEAHDADEELEAALTRATEGGLRIYALGVGEPDGAPIPLPEGGFKKDAGGDMVLSRLDEARLRRLAAATGGAYVRAVTSDDDVRALYVDEIRGKLEASERGIRRDKVWRERYQWPLAVALVGLVVGTTLGIGRRAAVGAAAMLLFARPAWAGATEDGLAAWRAREWEKAAELLGQARVEHPEDPTITRALAESLYRDGRYREAEQLFETLALLDSDNDAIHWYNAGNAAYAGGRLAEALESYQKALSLRDDFEPASKNAEAVEREIAARLQPPQEQPPNAPSSGGDPGESSEAPSAPPEEGADSQDGGDPSKAEDGTREAPPEGGERAQGEGASEENMAEGETPAVDASGEPAPAGAMTEEEAARLVDGVPDGKPRVVVGGRDTEKDW